MNARLRAAESWKVPADLPLVPHPIWKTSHWLVGSTQSIGELHATQGIISRRIWRNAGRRSYCWGGGLQYENFLRRLALQELDFGTIILKECELILIGVAVWRAEAETPGQALAARGHGARPMTLGRKSNQRLARQILGYFLRNPQAVDSLEGVVRWRLPDETVYQAIQETQRALDWLVARGYLQSSVIMGAGRIFSLSEQTRLKAERFLSREKSEGE